MSYYLSENINEKVKLTKKVINQFLDWIFSADEVHFILDSLLIPSIMSASVIGSLIHNAIGDLNENLSYYQPDENSRLESSLLYWEKNLRKILNDFLLTKLDNIENQH